MDIEEDNDLVELHTKLHKEIFVRAKNKLKDVIKAFSSSKTFAKGYVRATEFDKVVRGKLYTKMTVKEMEMLTVYWDRDKEGTIDYHAFALWLNVGNETESITARFLHQMSLLDNHDINDGFEKATTRGDKLNEKGFTDVLLNTFGLLLSRCEVRALYGQLDSDQIGSISIEKIKKLLGKTSLSNGTRGRDRDGHSDDGGNGNLNLISRRAQDDIADAAKDFLGNSENKSCLGKIFSDLADESRTAKLSRKQLRKGLVKIGAQLNESDEGVIFECFDHKGDGVAVEDIVIYCMHLAQEGDSLEAAQAFRQTLEKKKIPAKDLARALIKVDIKHKGTVSTDEFEKVFFKLCGGEQFVKRDLLTDIERYMDPQHDGEIDIMFVTGMATACADTARAESKLKQCFKLLRARGSNYREAVIRDCGASSSGDGGKIADADDLVGSLFSLFGLPMLRCEGNHYLPQPSPQHLFDNAYSTPYRNPGITMPSRHPLLTLTLFFVPP